MVTINNFKADVRALALRQSELRRANARNVSFETLYGGQFTLLTLLIILNSPNQKLFLHNAIKASVVEKIPK